MNNKFVYTAENMQIGFQKSGSPVMDAIISLHDFIMFYIIVICFFVFFILILFYYKYSYITQKLNYNYVTNNFYISFFKNPIIICMSIFQLISINLNLDLFLFLFNETKYTLNFKKDIIKNFTYFIYIYFSDFLFIMSKEVIDYINKKEFFFNFNLGLIYYFCYFLPLFSIYIFSTLYFILKFLVALYFAIYVFGKKNLILFRSISNININKFLEVYFNFSFRSLNNYNNISYKLFKLYNHNVILEFLWTIFPIYILLKVAISSFALLYAMDEIINPTLTVKVIGYQWYWQYEFGDLFINNLNKLINNNINYNISIFSNFIPKSQLPIGRFYLLEVDNPLYLPIKNNIRFLVTAMDVIHSWAIPSLGLKIDAVPGRLNQTSVFIKNKGIFYGQCSELCGAYHAFMPIMIKGVSIEEFSNWIYLKNKEVNENVFIKKFDTLFI